MTSKVNVIQDGGLILSSTCEMLWTVTFLIYKVNSVTYTLKSPRLSSVSRKMTYGGKMGPHSGHVSCS